MHSQSRQIIQLATILKYQNEKVISTKKLLHRFRLALVMTVKTIIPSNRKSISNTQERTRPSINMSRTSLWNKIWLTIALIIIARFTTIISLVFQSKMESNSKFKELLGMSNQWKRICKELIVGLKVLYNIATLEDQANNIPKI